MLVVHAEDGLDEISVAAPTQVAELRDGEIREYTITPEELAEIQGQRPINPPKPVLWSGTSSEAVELTTTYQQI